METMDESDAPAPARHAYLGPALDDPRIFLDGALRWLGIAWLLVALAPITFTLGIARSLWDFMPDEPWRAWPALLVWPAAGIALFALSRAKLQKGTKAIFALAAIAFAGLLIPASKELSESLWAGLPLHYAHNAPLYLGGFALLAAAARIAYRGGAEHDDDARRASLRLLAGGAFLLAVFYALPQRGEVPAVELVRSFFGDLGELSTRMKLGIWSNRIIGVLPVLILLLCGFFLWRRRLYGPGPLYAFFVATLPVLCLMGGLRAAMGGGGMGFVLALRNAAILGGVVILGAAALQAIFTQFFLDGPSEHGEPSCLWRDRLLRALLGPSAEPASTASAASLPGFEGLVLSPDAPSRIAAAHPLLRLLAARRVRALRDERERLGSPDESLDAYVRRRLRGEGPTGGAADADVATEPGGALPPFALGARATFVASIVVIAMIGAPLVLRPPSKAAEPWTPGPVTAEGLALFRDALPRYVAAISWARPSKGASPQEKEYGRKRLERARAELQAAAKPFPVVAPAVEKFIDVAERFGFRPKSNARLITAIDRAAHEAGLPFSVEAVVWTRRAGGGPSAAKPWKREGVELEPFIGLKVFRVRRVRTFEANGERAVSAWLERLDRLNLGEDHLGRSREDLDYALVLVDEVRKLAERDLTARDLALGGRHELGLSSPLGAAIGALHDAALAPLGADRTGARAKELVAAAVVASTERHEIEHERDRGDVIPSALFRMMASFTDRAIRHAARELRAYLAELATTDAPGAPRARWLSLGRILRMATSYEALGTAESFAGRYIVLALGRRAGLADDGEKSTSKLFELAIALARKVADGSLDLTKLAGEAYASAFGAGPLAFALAAEQIAPEPEAPKPPPTIAPGAAPTPATAPAAKSVAPARAP